MLPVEVLVGTAFGVDLLIGDPRWLPHPIRLIGWLANKSESVSRKLSKNEGIAGFIAVLMVLSFTAGTVYSLIEIANKVHPFAGVGVKIYLLYTSLALKDLARHSKHVYDALAANDLGLARKRVAMIVGRQTDQLDEEGVSRACVESVSENLVDGVTAPLFWAIIGGPIGAMLYKAVNTMDSMFGYKNEKYVKFGRIAAKLDDVCNFLPARITAVVVALVSAIMRFDWAASWHIWRRDRLKHASPNSAQTEAAFAGALGVRMGGPNYYFGTLVDKPYIGDAKSPAGSGHILQANRLLYGAAFACLLLFSIIRFVVVNNVSLV